MIVPELFHYINYAICFIVGVPSNALLAWLIVYRSTTDMQQYRPILLLATFTDIVYLTDLLVVLPMIGVKDSLAVFLSLGPFSQLPNPWGFAVLMTWVFFFAFSQFSLAAPFVYRYYVVCCGKKWGMGKFVTMLLVPVALSIEQVGLVYYTGYVGSAEEQLASNEHFGFPIDSNKTYVIPFFTYTNGGLYIISMNVMFISGANYILIVIFGRRLYRHLNEMAGSHLSQEQARVLNKQISTTLILQAVIPLVAEFMPSLEMVSSALSGVNFGESSLYMTGAYPWIPVLNPLVTMWVVRAYRWEIARIFFKAATGVTATMPTMRCSRVAPTSPPQIVINAIGGEANEQEC